MRYSMAAKGEGPNSVIGQGSIFEGKFFINGSLRVDGKFEGEIITNEDMVIGEHGRVKTNIKAKRVLVSGIVVGNIEADQEVMVRSNAKVLGNMKTPNIDIEDNVLIKGEMLITGPAEEKQNIQRLIEDSYNR